MDPDSTHPGPIKHQEAELDLASEGREQPGARASHDADVATSSEAGPVDEEATLRSIVRSRIHSIVLMDASGSIVFANESAERLLGLTKKDASARIYDPVSWHATTLDGGPWPAEKQAFQRVLTTGLPVEDVRHAIEFPDGRRSFISVSGEPLRSPTGPITSVVLSIRDITEFVSAQTSLREHRDQLRIALEAGRMGAWEWILESDQVRWSDEMARLYGLGPSEAPADYASFAELVHPDDIHRFEETITRVLESGEEFSVEHRIVQPDGNQRWVTCRGSVERLGGRAVRLIGTELDVTDQRRLAEQMANASRLESIGRLAGGVAHDFNNLLTTISGSTELAMDGIEPESASLPLLETVLEATARGAALTRRLLAFAGQHPIAPRPVDLTEVLNGIDRLLSRLIGEDVAIEWLITDNIWPVEVDPAQVEQLLINLAVNARDAMPEGGELQLAAENIEAAEPLGGKDAVRLSVEDTGHGIPEEHLSFIFDPFFTTKPSGSGTGLGLAVCKDIIEGLGGEVIVESHADRGTRFEIYLPRTMRTVEEDTSEEEIAASGGSETLLVVEDDGLIRGLITSVLRQTGYTVLQAGDGVEALELAEQENYEFDLLVADLVMPFIGGRELAERLRAHDPHLPVLFTSGYMEENARPEGLQGDLVAFLPKPFTPADVAREIRTILDVKAEHPSSK